MRARPIHTDLDTEVRAYVYEWSKQLRHNGVEVRRQFREMIAYQPNVRLSELGRRLTICAQELGQPGHF